MNLQNSTPIRLLIFFLVGVFSVTLSNAQLLTYTNATNGSISSVAAHTLGTPLSMVNGAVSPSSPCGTGFSSAGYKSVTIYSTALAGVEVNLAPAPGFSLSVTGFAADLRRSGTGPASLRFAYSTNGGTTWTSQTANQTNPSASCGAGTTLTWNTAFTVTSPASLKFRIYGFNASSTTGTEQILNLKINGRVLSACTAPTLSTTVTNEPCNGNSVGAITLTATGGTTPITYLWSNSATTQNLSALLAGTYKVTATANGGCTATASATVTQPAALSATISAQTNTGCTGNGAATVAATGGTSPYTYSWNTSPVQTTATASNLPVGIYNVTVKDAHTCSTSASASITSSLAASGLAAAGITDSSAMLSWNAVSGASGYNVQYRKTGATSWSTISVTAASKNIAGLSASTAYEFQVQIICTGGASSAFSVSTTFTTLAAPVITSVCDTTLWNHVYHSYRLTVLNPCTYVTGTVDHLIYEADGDIHIRLHVDTVFSWMLNSLNVSGQYGDLVLEPVCATTVTQTDAIASCQGFSNTVYIPNVGEHVKATGPYVNDVDHGWNELHPLTSIVISTQTSKMEAGLGITDGPNDYVDDDYIAANVFPNPANDIVNLSLAQKPSSIIKIEIMDALGRSAGQYQMLETTKLKITTTYLPEGMYYYNIIEGTRVMNTGKFVVAHAN